MESEYLIAWFGDDHSGALADDEWEVFGQRLDAATGSEVGENDFRISRMGPDGNKLFVGGYPELIYNPADNAYLAVFMGTSDAPSLDPHEYEIFIQALDGVGAPSGAAQPRISDMGPDGDWRFDAYNPSVAYNSIENQALVIWRGDDNTAPLVDEEFEIFGQRIAFQSVWFFPLIYRP
jgi:hypothetical protein